MQLTPRYAPRASPVTPVWKLKSLDWRVDYLLSSSKLQQLNEPSVQLKMTVASPTSAETKTSDFSVDPDKFRLFVAGRIIVVVGCQLASSWMAANSPRRGWPSLTMSASAAQGLTHITICRTASQSCSRRKS